MYNNPRILLKLDIFYKKLEHQLQSCDKLMNTHLSLYVAL